MMSNQKQNDLYHDVFNVCENNVKSSLNSNIDIAQAKNSSEILGHLGYIENRITCINTAISQYHIQPRSEMLLSVLEEIERARYAARQIVPFMDIHQQDTATQHVKSMRGIEISVPPGTILKIAMVPLVAYPIKGGYNIYFDVKEALGEYFDMHPLPEIDITTRYVLVYRRIVPGNLVLATGRCDNDNFEMKRVTNAIAESIGVADSVDKFSFYYTTVNGKESKAEAILINENQFSIHLSV